MKSTYHEGKCSDWSTRGEELRAGQKDPERRHSSLGEAVVDDAVGRLDETTAILDGVLGKPDSSIGKPGSMDSGGNALLESRHHDVALERPHWEARAADGVRHHLSSHGLDSSLLLQLGKDTKNKQGKESGQISKIFS